MDGRKFAPEFPAPFLPALILILGGFLAHSEMSKGFSLLSLSLSLSLSLPLSHSLISGSHFSRFNISQ